MRLASDWFLAGGVLSPRAIASPETLCHRKFVKQLEMPEERYTSIVATRETWTSQIKDPETKSKLDQIVDTMNGDLKEYLSLMISNAK